MDAVYIGLPTYMHGDLVERCATAGKHVLCEKCFTINTPEAIKALEVVSEHNTFFMEAQMHRCHPIIPQLKSYLKDQPLGKIHSVNGVFTAPIIEFFNRTAGGSILDLGCYPMSLLQYFCGEIESMTGSATIVSPQKDGEGPFDSCSNAEVRMLNGITASIRCANNEDMCWIFDIKCEKGTVSLTNLWDDAVEDAFVIHHIDMTTETQVVTLPSNKSFYAVQMDIANWHIKNGCQQVGQVLSSSTGSSACVTTMGDRKEEWSAAMNWDDTKQNMRALDMWRSAVSLAYSMDRAE